MNLGIILGAAVALALALMVVLTVRKQRKQ